MSALFNRVIATLLLPLLVACVISVTGCGGGGDGPQEVADHDELSAYLSEHGDDTDLDADVGE